MPESAVKHPSCYHVGYGLSCAEYDQLLAESRGCCMLCKRPSVLPRQIDHDHELGSWAVRGIVCGSCNQCLKWVDCGVKTATADIARYLANAWHLRQPGSAAKRARVRDRTECGECGLDVAVRSDGGPWRHWSRHGGPPQICPSIRTSDTSPISWHSADPDLKPRIEAEAAQRGITLRELLDEVMAGWLARLDGADRARRHLEPFPVRHRGTVIDARDNGGQR